MRVTDAEREAALKELDKEHKGDCAGAGIAKTLTDSTMATRNKGKDDLGDAS